MLGKYLVGVMEFELASASAYALARRVVHKNATMAFLSASPELAFASEWERARIIPPAATIFGALKLFFPDLSLSKFSLS